MQNVQSPSVVLTHAAREVLERVKAKRPGDLALVIGNGCCDSTAPYLFSNYLAGPNERLIGRLEDVPVFVDRALEESLAATEVVLDVRLGAEPDSFSCEAELGCRFVLGRLPAPTRSDS
jgi:uncharacterized protein (DUF779 family)